jgi:hypothetical protein
MSYHRRAPARNIAGADMVLPPGKQFYAAVKFLASSIRLRLAVVGLRDAETDLAGAARPGDLRTGRDGGFAKVEEAMLPAEALR